MTQRTVICIQGPTASGKSELAERIALELGGEVVSADSMQVYAGMDIGTAKVPAQQRRVPYHCLDLVQPGQSYSAALFQRDARAAIEGIWGRGGVAVLCGGTGLYVRAVLDEMTFAPGGQQRNPVRERYERMAAQEGGAAVYEELRRLDPASAAVLHPNNVRRVIRALEMLQEGESYAQRKRRFRAIPAHYPSVKLALDVERDVLYRRIDARVERMVGLGLVAEVQGLLDAGLRDGLTAPQAIGYKEIVAVLEGRASLEEAVESIKRSTRRYAKRQLTWLRGDPAIVWVDATEGITQQVVETALGHVRAGMHVAARERKAQAMDYQFAKLDGAGNDFVMIEDLADEVSFTPGQVARICDRHFGIGADGVIVVKPSPRPECAAYMDYYNSDGTKAQMCGNGVRCFAKFLVDRGIVEPSAGTLVADTLSGPHPIDFFCDAQGKVTEVRVDMGEPIFAPAQVPTALAANHASGAAVEVPVTVGESTHAFTCISMGNPHAIAFVDDVAGFPVTTLGPLYECCEAFPEKANIEFAHVRGSDIEMRVWERGCGETLACGTGSCATAVAAALTGRAGRSMRVHVLGGVLSIEWAQDNHVYMTGPASQNFAGSFSLEEICQ